MIVNKQKAKAKNIFNEQIKGSHYLLMFAIRIWIKTRIS